jgi:hypothetical protein
MRHSTNRSIQMYAIALLVGVCVVCPLVNLEWRILWLVYTACAFGALASLWLARDVLLRDNGTPEMREVSDPIREGAEGFLRVQYTVRASYEPLYTTPKSIVPYAL